MMRLGHMLELIPSTLAGVAIGLTITQTIADTAGPSDFQVIYLPSGETCGSQSAWPVDFSGLRQPPSTFV